MITNYDAEAVAEAMGIGFLKIPQHGSSSDVTDKPSATRFAIDVLHDRLWMVKAEGNNRFTNFGRQPSRPKSGHLSLPSAVLIEKAVEKGLPRSSLRHLAEELAGEDQTQVSALEWLVVPRTTLERREEQLSPQESERTERVARLFVHANRALGSKPEAREFMTTPHPRLDGRSPLDAARTDLGARRVEQILNALEYGLAL